MAIYYTLGTQDGTPIDGAPKWNGRDKVRDDFSNRVAAAARHVLPELGDVYVVKVDGKLASGPIR